MPEAFLAAVTPGLAIAARSVAYPGQVFAGKVASVDSRVDPSTRSITVRALRAERRRACSSRACSSTCSWRAARRDALVVPEQALVPEQGDVFVFVREGRQGGEAADPHRPAPRGRRADRAGARGRRRVVTEGTQKLRDGARVQVASACRGAAPPAARG